MSKYVLTVLFFGFPLTIAADAEDSTFTLARQLLSENSHELAAVEFRRFALENKTETEQTAAYLFAGYAYLLAEKAGLAEEMLDVAEDIDTTAACFNELSLLSAENARLKQDPDSSLYYYDLLAEKSDDPDFRAFALRRAAVVCLNNHDIPSARRRLNSSPRDEGAALQALETYARGKDKSPTLGGLWGLIPGAGYWYSGETANGVRSLILNSLFIFGMVHTAENDQWGAFGAITFFELTWYSGSVYGGIDSAHRYNRARLADVAKHIDGDTRFRPVPAITVPLFKLEILF